MNHGVTKTEANELMQISHEMQLYSMSQAYDLNRLVETLEIDRIHFALQVNKNNKTRAAKMLGLKRTCLLAKMKKYGILV